MSVENFFTTQAQTLLNIGQKPAENSGKDSTQLSNLNFIDLILARITENSEGGSDTPTEREGHEVLQSDNPLLDKNPKLNLAELLASNPEIEEELKDFIAATQLGPESELTQVLQLNQQAFDDVLKPLTDGIITSEEIANGSPRILQAFLIETPENQNGTVLNISNLKEKIKAVIEGNKDAITITNLTPDQVTTLQNLPETAELPEELAGNPFLIIVQLVPTETQAQAETPIEISDDPTLQNLVAVLVPPVHQPQQKNANAAFDPSFPAQASERAHSQIENLAARLNALNVGGNEEALFTIEDYDSELQLLQQNNGGKGKNSNEQNFTALLKNASEAPATSLPNLSALPSAATNIGSLLASFELTPALIDEYGLNTASTAQSTLGTMTSLVTQAQSAATPHPATQMVAVNMQKTAGNGENRSLTLQLDPPELGRVQVKMEFGPDKSIKALVTTEKPETFMMMQRDAQTLERALQDIGLDTGDGLNFELAEHGFDFDQDNQRGGGHDSGGTGAGDDADAGEEIIESTMTWHIDPDSGHTRYDILA